MEEITDDQFDEILKQMLKDGSLSKDARKLAKEMLDASPVK